MTDVCIERGQGSIAGKTQTPNIHGRFHFLKISARVEASEEAAKTQTQKLEVVSYMLIIMLHLIPE